MLLESIIIKPIIKIEWWHMINRLMNSSKEANSAYGQKFENTSSSKNVAPFNKVLLPQKPPITGRLPTAPMAHPLNESVLKAVDAKLEQSRWENDNQKVEEFPVTLSLNAFF